MQHLTTYIDAVSSVKTNMLKTFVTEESMRKPMQTMVDAEAQLSKAVVSYYENLFSKFKMN